MSERFTPDLVTCVNCLWLVISFRSSYWYWRVAAVGVWRFWILESMPWLWLVLWVGLWLYPRMAFGLNDWLSLACDLVV